MLSSQSRRSSANSLKEETDSIVDYFDLDECLNVPSSIAVSYCVLEREFLKFQL